MLSIFLFSYLGFGYDFFGSFFTSGSSTSMRLGENASDYAFLVEFFSLLAEVNYFLGDGFTKLLSPKGSCFFIFKKSQLKSTF